MSLKTRTLGKNGPKVPALGFGLMGLSSQQYGTIPSDEERFAILDRALELGATFWDTADLYGDNEKLVGEWFRRTGQRDKIFLADKFGFVKGSKTYETDTSAEYCRKACEESLKALGTDYIDLYYPHNLNPNTPIEETMRALKELQDEGKIRHIGLAAVTSTTLRRAVKIAPVACVQTEYALITRDIEGESGHHVLATARDLGIAVVAAVPLGRGLLTTGFSTGQPSGDSADKRAVTYPRFHESNREQNVRLAAGIRSFADKKGCTTSQLALAWLLKQGEDIVPIPGTKKIKYLEENQAALKVSLTDEEEAEIRKFAEANQPAGPQAPEAFLAYLYRDTVEENH